MEYERAGWKVIHQEIAHAPRVEDGAGIYLHDGATHLVGHYTAAEALLVSAGALLIATVRFDRSAADVGRRTGDLHPVPAYSITGSIRVPSPN